VGDETLKTMEQVVLKPENLPEELQILANDLRNGEAITGQFRDTYTQDSVPSRVLRAIRKRTLMTEMTVLEYCEKEGYLYYQGKNYVPDESTLQLQLIKEHHEMALPGQTGRAKMFDLLSLQ
jgi:hypothetical protein